MRSSRTRESLEEVLKKENPTHIGVAFDPAGPTFRHEAYEQYKAQREETPEAIRFSVPIIKDIIYRIPILEVAGYEADDVIGTLATEAGRQGITTYMMTPDKDYGQLVGEHVFMYRPKHTGGFEVMGTEEVKAKFDIQSTLQVIDMLGLMGDASDNIPGCPGVGEKTAQKLIAQFGSIENLLANTDQLKGALKTKVETNREQIAMSPSSSTCRPSSAKSRTRKRYDGFSRNWNSAPSSTACLVKTKPPTLPLRPTRLPAPSSPSPTLQKRPLRRPLPKAICLRYLRTRGRAAPKIRFSAA